jgi:hypothetical protein
MTADDGHYPRPDLGTAISTIATIICAYVIVAAALYLVLS